MAEQDRFMLRPQQTQDWVLSSYAHALHLDAILVARYLRNLCSKRGVTRIEATVKNVTLDKKSFIESLELENGTAVSSDFFIDCTGFKALLIEKSL
jgi:tryptophan halogenase